MATTSKVTHVIDFSGDVDAQLVYVSEDNELSPAATELVTLALGDNSITSPSGDVTGVTIVPPEGNILEITLKGVAGDMGVELHPTNPTTISFGDVASFVLTAEAEISGLRLIWS